MPPHESKEATQSLKASRARFNVWVAIAIGLAIIALLRVTATYRVFSNTYDEQDHIGAGMEWLELRRFTFEPKHPPLGRVAVALAPYLDGLRLGEQTTMSRGGKAIVYARGTYVRNLSLARLGILPFLLASILCVWVWSRRLWGDRAAALAVALFTTTPLVLAHSGLATTDIPATGTLIWAMFAFSAWLDRRTVANGVAFGASTALALLAKLSTVAYLPAAAVAMIATRWLVRRNSPDSEASPSLKSRETIRSIVLGGAVALLVIWSMYRFSIDRRFTAAVAGGIPIPAPEFYDGIRQLFEHNDHGHPGFLLGEARSTGWWYFFPIAFVVKTPIALVVLTVVGAVAAWRIARTQRDWRALAPFTAAVAIMLIAMTSKINIGSRHLLPLFPLIAIVAAGGAMWMWNKAGNRGVARGAVAALLAWQVISTTRAHPDYLSYFNVLAGRRPERILLDSDLDWGQDLLRLADTVRVRQIDSISVAYFGTADPALTLPARVTLFAPNERPHGWVAASEQFLSHASPRWEGYKWLNSYQPVARIGASMRLYRIEPR